MTPRTCNVCHASTANDPGRCTNGRCSACHAKVCTPGGDTSPGHGYGSVPSRPEEELRHVYDCINRRCSKFGMKRSYWFTPTEHRKMTGFSVICTSCKHPLRYTPPLPKEGGVA